MASYDSIKKRLDQKYSKEEKEKEKKSSSQSTVSKGSAAASAKTAAGTDKKASSAAKASSFSIIRNSMERKYNPDVSFVDDKYINAFLKESDQFAGSFAQDYARMGYTTSTSILEERAKAAEKLKTKTNIIRAYLNKNAGSLPEDYFNNMHSFLDRFNNTSSESMGMLEAVAERYNDARFASYNADEAKVGLESYESSKLTQQTRENEKPWYEKIAGYLGEVSDTTLPMGNTANVTKAIREDTSLKEPTSQWNDDLRMAFGYLYAQDRSQAAMFAEQVNERLNAEEKAEQAEKIRQAATDNWASAAGHTAGAILASPLGMADYLADLVEYNAIGEINERSGDITPFEYSQEVTGSISEHLNEEYGTLNDDIPIFGSKGWGDVYSLGTSMAQSSLAAYTGGSGQALVTFFGSAAASGMDEAKLRGASDEQALKYGLASGLAEAVPEMVGVENLLNIGSSHTMRELLTNVLKQGSAEAIEETMTSTLNLIADNWVMGDFSNMNILIQHYMGQGWSEEEAKVRAWVDIAEDIAFDAFAGFASGVVHAAPQTAYQTYSENARISNIYGSSAQELVQQGLESPEGSLSRDLAEKYKQKMDGNGTLTGAELHRLITANEQQIAADDYAAIKQAAENRLVELGEVDNANGLAEVLAKQATKKKLTKAEKGMIQTSRYGQRVANELNPQNIQSENYSTNWAEKIGTKQINAQEYNKALYDLAEEMSMAPQNTSRISNAPSDDAEDTNRMGQEISGRENTPAGNQYEASAHGQTILKSTGETVSIKEIADIKDGKMTLKLDDGRTVDAGDVSYASQDEALIYEAVADMGVNALGANVLVGAYQTGGKVDTPVYAHGIKEAFRYGQYNYPMQESAKGPFSSMLTEYQRSTAYKLGQMFSGKQVSKAQAIAGKSSVVDKGMENTGKVHFDGDRSSLTERQSASISALETVADALGVQIYVFESQADENGKHTGANGWYDLKDGSIHVDLYAGANGESTMLFTAAHELVHFIKQWSPAKFKILANFLMKEYGRKGVSVETLVQAQIAKAKKNGRTISYDTAYEEVIADSMETMLADGKVVEKLAGLKQQDKSLWQKIKDYIGELAAKIRKVYKSLTPDSVEGRYVAEMKDAVEALQELFAEGLTEAGENYRGTQKNTVKVNGETLYSDRNVKALTNQDVRDLLDRIKRREITGKGYVPIRISTPGIVQERLFANDYPIIMPVEKAFQAMSEDEGPVKGKNVRGHNLSVDDLIAIIERMDSPDHVYSQQSNDRGVEVIRYKAGGNNLAVIIEFDNNINPVYMNGYRGGTYNIAITTFEVDGGALGLFQYASDKGWTEVFNKQKEGDPAKKFPATRPFAIEQDSLNKSVAQNSGDVNRQMTVEENGADESVVDVKYSIREGMSETERYDELKDKRITLASDKRSADYVEEINSLEALQSRAKSKAEKIIKPLAAKLGIINTPLRTPNVEIDFLFTASGGLAESLHKQLRYGGSYVQFAKTLINLDRVLENAVLIEVHGDKYAGTSRANQNLQSVYVLFSAFHTGDCIVPVQMEIKKSSDVGGRLYLAVAMTRIEADVLGSANGKNQTPSLISASEYNIADIFREINPKDAHFLKYLPDGFLSEEQRNAKRKSLAEDAERIAKYQDRPEESVSNRSLLANALEGAAQNDIERKRLAEYKEKIGKINEQEAKLRQLNAEIRELSFGPGKRDKAKLRQLKDEAIMTTNRINIYDKQLLRLEAAAPLQKVLEREKAKAYKRAEQKGKEAIAQYRKAAEKKQKETIARYQESRKQGIDNRHKTEMRHKIQKVVKTLNDLLLKETKDRHVPEAMKAVVAEALDAIDMDITGAEERIARYDMLIAKEKNVNMREELQKSRERIANAGGRFNERVAALKAAYDSIRSDPVSGSLYDDVISQTIQDVVDLVGKTSLRDMSMEQLEAVYDMYKMIRTSVSNANKAFRLARNESISALGIDVMSEVAAVGGSREYTIKALEGVKGFAWNNLKPIYAFKAVGSKTLTELFENVRLGEDVWATDVSEAKEFYTGQAAKYGRKNWDFDKRYQFESNTGRKFSLSLEQIMSLYAYSKREQAEDHLMKGGFVFDDAIEVVQKKAGVPVKYKVNTASAYNLSLEQVGQIISKLTPQQKAFVDVMQSYLSDTMGAKGNEVSMALYDVKLFKEKNYFPLKSARQYMFQQTENTGEVRLKNSGFSKKVVKHASNPVILGNFMDVWANHVNDMSMYHAFVLPLEDFNRVFNYKSATAENTDTESVKGRIQNAYGSQAEQYIKTLLTDLNGGVRVDQTTGIINKMMGKFKKGAVFASASVVVQQPSAIARAAAYIDMKYFIGAKVDKKRHKELWAEMKKYAPVVTIKEMGYFDTNMGRSTVSFITAEEYSGVKEKAAALVKDSDYRDEVLSKLPALADEVTWAYIWEAVKRETIDRNPGLLSRNRPEFMRKVGKRFTEVITNTQVYDSVLSRSANMRSRDTGMKMLTAFMAEPTTSINMVADAIIQGKRGDKRYARKAIGSVVASQILNAILVSFVYAARDEDEDKTYGEKYTESFVAEVLDGMNPLTYVPFMKDIVSIVQGYDVERSDMSVISDLWKAWKQLESDNISTYKKVENFAGSVCQIFGLPLKNVMRDVRAMYYLFSGSANGRKTTTAGLRYAVTEALPEWLGGGEVSNRQQLYEAYLNGDAEHITRMEARFEDQSAINSAIRKALRENDARIVEAAEAKLDGDITEYTQITQEIIAEGHFSKDNIVRAISSQIEEMNGEEDSGGAQKIIGLYKMEDFVAAVSSGDSSMADDIRADIIQTAQENGKTAEEAEASFASSVSTSLKEQFQENGISEAQAVKVLVTYGGKTQEDAQKRVDEWAFEEKYGFAYSDRGDAYRNGEISASELRTILMDVGGKTAEEANLQIQVYDWQKEVPGCDDITAAAIRDYNENCEQVGITKDVYYEAWTAYNDIDGDYYENGDSVPYSKVRKVMPYIDGLPLSAKQKTALALCWWAESTVRKYKTW